MKSKYLLYLCTILRYVSYQQQNIHPFYSKQQDIYLTNKIISNDIKIPRYFFYMLYEDICLSQDAINIFLHLVVYLVVYLYYLGKASMKKKRFLSGIARMRGGGLPMPEFFGPFPRSAFLVNKKGLFLQKFQCIELLTVFQVAYIQYLIQYIQF